MAIFTNGRILMILKILSKFLASFYILLLAGCSGTPVVQPTLTLTLTFNPTHTATLKPTSSTTPTEVPTPTEIKALTFVFYGDSTLKIGEVGRQGQVGFSFVDNLRTLLGPDYNLITANYGGRSAQWAYENLEQTVLSFNPDVVTLEWGWDDLHGCPGIFDPDTNSLLEYKLVALIKEHIKYLKLQIDALLADGIAVFVVTPIPTPGDLPWSSLGPNNELIWETNHWCRYNLGVERLAEAQRQLVNEYSSVQKPVYLVDVWQIFKNNPNAEKMYMDIPHPGSHGAELIAEGWLQAFKDSQIRY
jgi:hypothetical protein